jgi:lipoyl(octanoyl) transferase
MAEARAAGSESGPLGMGEPASATGHPHRAARELLVASLGVVPYAEALELQRAVARARIDGQIRQDVLLLLEHPPVVTLGRTARASNLMASPELLRRRGIELFEIERGGDVTFHGPGQLVGYPIVDLRRHKQDLHWYLRQVEGSLIRALGELGLPAERRPGLTGVWTRGCGGGATEELRKIASIGVHARDWVTWHGFALNVTTDLSYFDLMVPCGIDRVVMTSLARELGFGEVSMPDVQGVVSRALAAVFGLARVEVGRDALAGVAGAEDRRAGGWTSGSR